MHSLFRIEVECQYQLWTKPGSGATVGEVFKTETDNNPVVTKEHVFCITRWWNVTKKPMCLVNKVYIFASLRTCTQFPSGMNTRGYKKLESTKFLPEQRSVTNDPKYFNLPWKFISYLHFIILFCSLIMDQEQIIFYVFTSNSNTSNTSKLII